jgi:hypothetical protein
MKTKNSFFKVGDVVENRAGTVRRLITKVEYIDKGTFYNTEFDTSYKSKETGQWSFYEQNYFNSNTENQLRKWGKKIKA